MSRFLRASLGADFGYTPGEQPRGWRRLAEAQQQRVAAASLGAVAAAVAGAAADLARYPSPVAEPLRSVTRPASRRRAGAGVRRQRRGPGPRLLLPGLRVAGRRSGANRARLLAAARARRRSSPYATIAVAVERDGSLPSQFAPRDGVLRIVVNPNSPTGHWIEPASLEAISFADAKAWIVIDEAYCDFAPASCARPPRRARELARRANALEVPCARRASVGYAIGDPALIADLNAVRDSYPVDRCAIAGAHRGIDDEPIID